MKMFFINNQTDTALHIIKPDVVNNILEFCKEKRCTISNFMFYVFSLTESYLNNRTKNMIQLELCNCRGTLAEKKAAGTKAQSLGCYLTFDYEKSFMDNYDFYIDEHTTFNKHIGYPDTEFEMLLNKVYNKPLLDTFYSCTFSLIPFVEPKGVHIEVYSNGRFVLPSYIAMMFNVETNEIRAVYDFQTKIITKENIKTFHEKMLDITNQVLANPAVLLKDIK